MQFKTSSGPYAHTLKGAVYIAAAGNNKNKIHKLNGSKEALLFPPSKSSGRVVSFPTSTPGLLVVETPPPVVLEPPAPVTPVSPPLVTFPPPSLPPKLTAGSIRTFLLNLGMRKINNFLLPLVTNLGNPSGFSTLSSSIRICKEKENR